MITPRFLPALSAIVVSLWICLPPSRAQIAGSPDPTFTNPMVSPEALVSGAAAIAVQTDGKIVLAGTFLTIGSDKRNGLARLNADGTLDATFAADVTGYAEGAAIQADGKIVVFGGFNALPDGTVRNSAARFNPDGTLDTTFDPGAGPTDYFFSAALQPDNKLIVGGNFTAIDGVPRKSIARLNADGTLDKTFDPGAGLSGGSTGDDGYTFQLAVQPDGKVLAVGRFTTANGMTRNHIARFEADGTVDANFDPNANNILTAVTVQPDGKILIGGGFSTVGGVDRNNFARLNSDGTPDLTFEPGGGVTAASENDVFVAGMLVQSDGKIVIGGSFTAVNGTACDGIARVNVDGSTDPSFTVDLGANSDGVNAIALAQNDNVVVAGNFTMVDSQPYQGLVRLLGEAPPPVPPTVSVTAKNSQTTDEGPAGKLFFTRAGDDMSQPLTVNFKLQGSAVNGTDYQQLGLSAVIPAGAASVKLKVKPIVQPDESGTRTVKLKLLNSATNAYTVGTPAKAAISISEND